MIINNQQYSSPVFMMDSVEYNGVNYSRINKIYIKRDDFIPFSFGGNKARMGLMYFKDADEKGCNCVITTGGSNSNMCRIIANLAAERDWPCYILLIDEYSEAESRSALLEQILDANVIRTDMIGLYKELRELKEKLQNEGKTPYFIDTGGHGTIGVKACMDYFEEVSEYEKDTGIEFDRVYLTVGTGTTISGLVSAQIIHGDTRKKIIGISAAQKNPRLRGLVKTGVSRYLKSQDYTFDEADIENRLFLRDQYVFGGYGAASDDVQKLIIKVFREQGIPLDSVYTGKGFYGMLRDLAESNVRDEIILFIHTGGTPLFFEMVNSL